MSAPNANKLFIAQEIGLWIRDLIYTHLRGSTELNLKECRFSDFMETPIELLSDMVPGVFVTAVNAPNEFGDVDGSHYITKYRYRIVYYAAISTREQRETARMKGQRIADLLVENAAMLTPTVPGVYQSDDVHCHVDLLDFKPEENDVAQAINADYYAMAVECVIWRSTYTDT